MCGLIRVPSLGKLTPANENGGSEVDGAWGGGVLNRVWRVAVFPPQKNIYGVLSRKG